MMTPQPPRISIVVGCYNMARELPRTIRSLSPAMQGLSQDEYELIIVDNGSTVAFDDDECRRWVPNIRIIKFAKGSPSPVAALNEGIRAARADLIGLMIDGARISSPGIIKNALAADRLTERTVTLTLGFHLGPALQTESIRQGYNQTVEDEILAASGWTEDGYRLFKISVFAGSSGRGWFYPLGESNAIFMRRTLWAELNGLEERFQAPGGGFVNLDLLARAVALPGVTVVTLLGEGTFHQVHGGVATNANVSPLPGFRAEYARIRGHAFAPPSYQTLYLGALPDHAIQSLAWSANLRAKNLGSRSVTNEINSE